MSCSTARRSGSTSRGGSSCAPAKAGLSELFEARLRAHGSALPRTEIETLLAIDIELNAQGMGIWLDKGAA